MNDQQARSCSVCADAAEHAVIESIAGSDARAVTATGETVTIAIDLVPDAGVGDTVLVQQGVAIGRVPRREIQP